MKLDIIYYFIKFTREKTYFLTKLIPLIPDG